MFGDKSIYGSNTVSIDEKGRMFLPAFTNVEKGEELVLINNGSFYELVSIESVDNKINQIIKLIDESKTVEEMENLKQLLLAYSENIICKATIDSSRRFTTHGSLDKDKSYKVIGAKDRLFIKEIKKGK